MDRNFLDVTDYNSQLISKAVDIVVASIGENENDITEKLLRSWGVSETFLGMIHSFNRFSNWEYPDPKKQPDYKLPVSFDEHWEKMFQWNLEAAIWSLVFNHHHFVLEDKKASNLADAAVKAWKS